MGIFKFNEYLISLHFLHAFSGTEKVTAKENEKKNPFLGILLTGKPLLNHGKAGNWAVVIFTV